MTSSCRRRGKVVSAIQLRPWRPRPPFSHLVPLSLPSCTRHLRFCSTDLLHPLPTMTPCHPHPKDQAVRKDNPKTDGIGGMGRGQAAFGWPE